VVSDARSAHSETDGLANQFPQLCTKHNLGSTLGGTALIALELHDPNPSQQIPVIVLGGVHGRE
jgi:Zinc carboxypeptidase